MLPTESVCDYFTRVLNIVMSLTDIGEKVSDPMIMTKILGGLPRKFDSLVVAWDSVALASQTMDALEKKLIREESRLGQKEEDVTALYSSTRKGANNKRHNQRNKENANPKKNL